MEPKQLLDILHVCGKLKENTRHCILENGRVESVAEHSWRMTLMAYFVKNMFPDADMEKLYTMCLIHDLGEAFTGDIPAFLKNTEDEKTEENVLFCWVQTLPSPYCTQMQALYDEMMALETREAKIYKALDKLEALISHNESSISTWIPLEYELQQVYGNENVEFSDFMKKLRETVLQDSLDKIEQERSSGSAFLSELDEKKKITLSAYSIEKLQNHVYHIEDYTASTPSSIYLVGRGNEVLIVDGGNVPATSAAAYECKYILEELCYKKKVSMVLTHAHIDHIGILLQDSLLKNLDVQAIYMSEKDYVDRKDLGILGKTCMQGKQELLRFVKEGDTFRVGDALYAVSEAGAHTRGSIVIYAKEEDCVFTGDAFGSGYVWLFWNEEENPLQILEDSVLKVLKQVSSYRHPVFYPGHRYQQFLPSDVTAIGEMRQSYLEDMYSLLQKMRSGKADTEPYLVRKEKEDIYVSCPSLQVRICTTRSISEKFRK